MLGTNNLAPFVDKDTRHVSYPEQFRVELGGVGKRQEGQPGIIALKLIIVIPGRDRHEQFTTIVLLTPGMSYFTPHTVTGLKALSGCLAGGARLAYSVIDGQFKRRVAVGQWKPKT